MQRLLDLLFNEQKMISIQVSLVCNMIILFFPFDQKQILLAYEANLYSKTAPIDAW
jgi:hypothetical protein